MAGSYSYWCSVVLYSEIILNQEGGVTTGMYKDFTAVEIGDMMASNQPVRMRK